MSKKNRKPSISNRNDNESCGLLSSMTAPGHSRPAGHSRGTTVQPGTAVAQPSSLAQPWYSRQPGTAVAQQSSRGQPWHSRPAGHSHGTAVQPGTAVAQPSSRAQPWHSPPAGHSHGTAVQPGPAVARCMIVGGAHSFPGERNVPRGAIWLKYCSIVSQGGASEKYFDLYFIDLYL